MSTLSFGGRTLAVSAVVLLGMVQTAGAAPNVPSKPAMTTAAGSDLLVQARYRERHIVIREYVPDDYIDYDYYDYDYYRPRGYVYTSRRYYYYDGYVPYVRYRRGVRVRAPFVDVYIP